MTVCCVVAVVQAAWYGSTLPRMVAEYKSMLVRVQRQHGVAHPQAPFTTTDMNQYIDTRRRQYTPLLLAGGFGERGVGGSWVL